MSKRTSHGNVTIVTGAGSGIGRATAHLLAERKYKLALIGRTEASLHSAADAIRKESPESETLVVRADVSEPDTPRLTVDRVLGAWGRVDALINNAAVLDVRPIDQTDDAALTETFATNTFGPMRLVAALWPVFVRQQSGCVVNVSSIATVEPFDRLSMYAASKAALEALTRAIVQEGRAHGIRAFSIAPGAVETAMLRQVFSEQELPRQRTLEPSRIAQVILECLDGTREADLGQTIYLPNP